MGHRAILVLDARSYLGVGPSLQPRADEAFSTCEASIHVTDAESCMLTAARVYWRAVYLGKGTLRLGGGDLQVALSTCKSCDGAAGKADREAEGEFGGTRMSLAALP